ENERLLAVVIFLFSVIFPAIKLSMLSVLWYWKFTEARRRFLIDWIGQLGKWSMLDVFVLAITIVITKTSKFVEAEPKPGIYVFAASILLAMIVTMRVEYLAKKH
ncbi:MAG TPA: paraquat-inducible protein A, partial [Candidatus Omnitrophota bacterium]|nr:paraquat-inducible protein A [Candidatus Omnitrophota bacterium]